MSERLLQRAVGLFCLPAQTAQACGVAEYRLAAGDVLRVSVYQNPDLALEMGVSESGVLNCPLIGERSCKHLQPVAA